MAEPMHQRYDKSERRLIASAAEELWTDALLDGIVDAAADVLDGASWRGTPDGAPPRWVERHAATLALGAMALRAARTTALTIRAGYGAEALADLRRLIEMAGHAQAVANDASGQYAENWVQGRGKAASPRIAFGPESADRPVWELMSAQAHAHYASYMNHSGMVDEDGRLIHGVGPRRDPVMDSLWLWLSARQFARVLAAVLKVHPDIDSARFLAAAQAISDAEVVVASETASGGKHGIEVVARP